MAEQTRTHAIFGGPSKFALMLAQYDTDELKAVIFKVKPIGPGDREELEAIVDGVRILSRSMENWEILGFFTDPKLDGFIFTCHYSTKTRRGTLTILPR